MIQTKFPSWNPTIGDPTFMGWFTVLAYLGVTFLCYLVFRNSRQLFVERKVPQQKLFWGMLTVIMFFLAVNKQLDFQSYLTEIGRYFAHKDGWYERRLHYQHMLVRYVLYGSLFLVSFCLWYLWGTLRDNFLAIFGLSFLFTFIVLRASSFHHMDMFISMSVFGLKFNWILELSGISFVGSAAALLLTKPQERTPSTYRKRTKNSNRPRNRYRK